MLNTLIGIVIVVVMVVIVGIIITFFSKTSEAIQYDDEPPPVDVEEEESLKMFKVAEVKCAATCKDARKKYIYDGIEDCIAANSLAGGDKLCNYGCLGLGTCVRACGFDAISIKDGLAFIDHKKCTACGKCIEACPKHVIGLVPKIKGVSVFCNSKNKGELVKQICSCGCTGCGECEKVCPEKVIHIEDNLAVIDKEGCSSCGECIDKCPQTIILWD